MGQLNNMDLEELALWSRIYGTEMSAQANREANQTNIALAREASAFSAHEAQKNRDWQQVQSGTAHQREMADLIAAGLNPILTATGGAGAGIGSGATGQAAQGKVQSEIPDSPLSGLASDVTSSRRLRDIETEQLKANLQQTKSNVAMANSNMQVNQQNIQTQQSTIAKQMEEIATQRTQQTVNSALAQKAIADANASGSYAALLDSQNKGVGYENAKKQADSRIYTDTGEVTNKGLGILNYIKSWLPWTH